MPVMLRRPDVPRSGEHVTSTASTCSSDIAASSVMSKLCGKK